MDASVDPDPSPSDTVEKDEINSANCAQENSPPSTSKQEVNKQSDDLSNNAQNDEHVPVDQICNQNFPESSDEPLIVNGCSDGDVQKLIKKAKKNVFFPGDSTIVKSYLDPRDPWKNVPNWRTEDLLKAYKRGCEKHGAKPLNKVLQQLQCIENVGERYEILSLKGERLDLKQCESLEEIFKYVRFRCIDVEATHLDDEMAVALFEMVEYYESACKLNISFNKSIGPRGWVSCSKLVRKTPCLTFIDARNCDLNDRVIPILGRALRMGCFLQRLHLQNAVLAGRALVILVAALKMNETLKELFLGDNKFMPTDGVQIGNLLKYNHRLELLDLRNNHLQDVGVGHVCDGLAEQCMDTGLLTLVLWNNQITFQGMTSINKAMTSADHLETLNLGHNPITNEGIHILKDGLLISKGLLKLGLSGTKVTCEGAVALAEVIADNIRLVRLDLQENDIKTAGLMALSLALRVNESITRLDIDRETKRESGVKDYAEQQKRLQKEIIVLLERNRDLLHKREEEHRQIEVRNHENTMKLQEAAHDISLEEPHEYIPSGDRIHRPKLLFLPLPQLCPEHELDSPVLGEEFLLETTSPDQTVHLVPATGADLLSPQYCPNPKATAKKIFSVTRVSSPIDASSGFALPNFKSAMSNVINSPTQVHPPVGRGLVSSTAQVLPHLLPPLPNVDLPSLTITIPLPTNLQSAMKETSPSSLQRVMEEQTLVSYIQQIVDDNSDTVTTETYGDRDTLTSEIDRTDNSDAIRTETCGDTLTSEINRTDNLDTVRSETNGDNGQSCLEDKTNDDLDRPKFETNNHKDQANKEIDQMECISDNVSYHSNNANPEGDQRDANNIVPFRRDKYNNTEYHSENSTNSKIDQRCYSTSSSTDEDKIENEEVDSRLERDDVQDIRNSEIQTESDLVECEVKQEAGSENCDNILRENIPVVENRNQTMPEEDIANQEHIKPISTDCEVKDEAVGEDECHTTCSKTASLAESADSSQTHYLSIVDCKSEMVHNSEPKSLSDLDMPENIASACGDGTEDDMNGEFVDCVDTLDLESDVNGTGIGNHVNNGEHCVLKENTDKDNGDAEPWNTVNESDLDESMNSVAYSESTPTGSNNKPDFHTNLSFNGLKQELASLIDEVGGSSPATAAAAANGVVLKNGDNTDTLTQTGAETNSDWPDDTTTTDMGASS